MDSKTLVVKLSLTPPGELSPQGVGSRMRQYTTLVRCFASGCTAS